MNLSVSFFSDHIVRPVITEHICKLVHIVRPVITELICKLVHIVRPVISELICKLFQVGKTRGILGNYGELL